MFIRQEKIVKLFFLLLILFSLFSNPNIPIQAAEDSQNYKEVINNSVENDTTFNSDEGITFPSSDIPNPQSSVQTSPFPFYIFIIIGLIIFLISGGIYLYSLWNKKKMQIVLIRDYKRKHDIERIRYCLSAFAKTYGRYPDGKKGEFIELLQEVSPLPVDPLSGQDLPNGPHHQFNYYYDNQSLDVMEKGRENTQYYRLWAYLENDNDPDINPVFSKDYKNIYLKTSLDPLNPVLLKDISDSATKNKQKPKPIKYTIEEHRKESIIRFLLILTGLGLTISAIVNGILYYLFINK